MELLQAISLAVKDLGRWDIKVLSIINGIVWLIIWIGIGYFSWDYIFSFTMHLLNLIPFSFIKFSGGYIIYALLGIQAVLITIGILFALLNEPIEKALEKTHFHYLGVTVGTIVILFWGFIFFFFKDQILGYIYHILKFLPFKTVEELIGAFLTVLYFYLLYTASIFFSFLFIIIPKIKHLAKQEYPDIEIGHINYAKLIFILLRDFIIFFVLAVILYPVMLIPVLNFLTLLLLFVISIKESYHYLIKAMFHERFSQIELWIVSLISALLNFLPVINIFSPAFEVLTLYHQALEKKKEKLASNVSNNT